MKSKLLARLRTLTYKVTASLWFLPALLSVFAVLLALGLLYLDRLYASAIKDNIPWAFGGDSRAGRNLLTVIAGAVIAVVSVAFSITIVAVQQAATQYSPRLLRQFTRDRGNQFTLGVYIATFIYSLIILRSIRDSTATMESMVPQLSISTAMILAIFSLGLLVYFIHHTVRSLQVFELLTKIQGELQEEIEKLYPKSPDPESIGKEHPFVEVVERQLAKVSGILREVCFSKGGYIKSIDIEGVCEAAKNAGSHFVVFPYAIGDHASPGLPAIYLSCDQLLSKEEERKIISCIEVDEERTISNDPLFGVRQMTDIGIKALSPGINDPTTAEECIRRVGRILSTLAMRLLTPCQQEIKGTTYISHQPVFEDFVSRSFNQMLEAALTHSHVLYVLGQTLDDLKRVMPNTSRRRVIYGELETLSHRVESSQLDPTSKDYLLRYLRTLLSESPPIHRLHSKLTL